MTASPKNKQKNVNSIKNWRDDEKPRERLMQYGASSLSDTELLAIIIGGGTIGKTAIDVARELINKFSSLNKIAQSDFSEFKSINGIGPAKAVTLAAAMELSKRINESPINTKKIYKSTTDLTDYYIPKFQNEKKEKFIAILLNSKLQIIRESTISVGLVDRVLIHPREVFHIAIAEMAHSIILMHNHPSGIPDPSFEDKEITKKLVESGKILNIQVRDHIIIAGNRFYSFLANGLI